MRVVFSTAAILALIGACTTGGGVTDIEPPRADRTIAGITYRADLAVMESFPVQLHAMVSVRNVTDAATTATFPDGCLILLRAYRDASRTGKPAWDEARSRVCTMAIESFTLAPHDSTVISGRTIGAAEILGDSLPPGRYYFTALVRPGGQAVELVAGVADLAQ